MVVHANSKRGGAEAYELEVILAACEAIDKPGKY